MPSKKPVMRRGGAKKAGPKGKLSTGRKNKSKTGSKKGTTGRARTGVSGLTKSKGGPGPKKTTAKFKRKASGKKQKRKY
jgi:hypothetical protein